MYTRLFQINNLAEHSIFIFGPRGTGKTSWLKQNYPDALYFDLLKSDTYTELLAQPSRLENKIPKGYTDWVILDEIQKIPELLNEVHRLIEHKKLKFILTGSSARKLKSKGVNLLAGRAITYYMHPLSVLELGDDYSLDRALKIGNLPAAIHHSAPNEYLKSYIQTYLKEEVMQEGLTRNLSLFTRFLETASFSQGEVINYTEIARETHSNRHTIENFFGILEDLLIGYRLNVFTKRAKRDVISHPKFYYFDVGVFRSIRPKGPLDSPEEIDGPALETLFLQEIKAINDYFKLEYDFYYWRTRSQVEVDFIAYGPQGLHAFEIKRKSKLTTNDFKGLKLFRKDYPVSKCYMFYGGNESYTDNDIEVHPIKTGLVKLKELLSVTTDE